MEFSLKNYNPINYSKWDFSGLGANIYPILNNIERIIWREAIPFQDMRDDEGQGEIVTLFALRLLDYANGKREIAIPAAMLHDTGFSKIENAGKRHRDMWVKGKTNNVSYRRIHQDFGVQIAKDILGRLDYNQSHIEEICAIIGDHDTRLKPTTESGKLMRDADILWRFTVPQFRCYGKIEVPSGSPAELLGNYKKVVGEPIFNIKEALLIARIELANTLMYLFPNQAPALLQDNYSVELDRLHRR